MLASVSIVPVFFGCNALGTIEISLKINDKFITILVCKDCKYKFKE